MPEARNTHDQVVAKMTEAKYRLQSLLSHPQDKTEDDWYDWLGKVGKAVNDYNVWRKVYDDLYGEEK